MINQIYLQKYSIQIISKKTNEPENINSIGGTTDFYIFLRMFLKHRVIEEFKFSSQGYEKKFKVKKGFKEDFNNRVFYGYINGGLKGEILEYEKDSKRIIPQNVNIEELTEEEIDKYVDKFKEQNPDFRPDNNHSSITKHLFYFWVPKGGKKGYFFFQKKSTRGVKTRFQRALEHDFSKSDLSTNFKLRIGAEYDKSTFGRYIEKYPLTKISFIKNYQNLAGLDDIIGVEGDDNYKEQSAQKVSITVKGMNLYRYKHAAKEWLKGNKKDLSSITMFDGSEDEDISLTVSVEGKPRSYRIYRTSGLPEEDITKHVKPLDDDGNPSMKKFINIVEDRISDYGRYDAPSVKVNN